MYHFEIVPRAPGHPTQPCKRDCPNRTVTCKHTCPKWTEYEAALIAWRESTHPETLFLTSTYTVARESKFRQFSKTKKHHYR